MIEWQQTRDTNGQPTREFSLDDVDRRTVTGALWLPDQPNPHDTLMCFGHGASGDRYQAPICNLAGRFVEELGIPVLSLDGPVHGLRQVDEGGRKAFGPEYQREGSLDDMTADWTAAIDVVRALPEISAAKLAYFGLSMGTILGLPLLATRDDLTVATLGLFGIGEHTPHREEQLANAAAVTCPVLYLMQLEDELFDRTSYLSAFDALGSDDKRIHANPGHHPEVPGREMHFAFDFMATHLTGKSTGKLAERIAE